MLGALTAFGTQIRAARLRGQAPGISALGIVCRSGGRGEGIRTITAWLRAPRDSPSRACPDRVMDVDGGLVEAVGALAGRRQSVRHRVQEVADE